MEPEILSIARQFAAEAQAIRDWKAGSNPTFSLTAAAGYEEAKIAIVCHFYCRLSGTFDTVRAASFAACAREVRRRLGWQDDEEGQLEAINRLALEGPKAAEPEDFIISDIPF